MIAISYRRQDSNPVAGRIYDRAQAEFGKGNVFMNFDSIPYGVDSRTYRTDAETKYTGERVSAHIELTSADSADVIRWEGTMRNTPPDNRAFPVSFSRPKK